MENMQIIYKKINEIKPYIRNPRRNDETVKKLVEIIPKVGFNVPIVIDEKGIIVKGHARFKAAIKLGMEEVPCIITDADEDAIRLDRISDNKISEFSEWISDELLHEIDSITEDISSLGFELPTYQEGVFDDYFVEEFDEQLGTTKEDEEKRKRYEEFLKEQEKQSETPISFVKEKDLQKVKEKTKEFKKDTKKYYKLVCECCGHTMFVDVDDTHEFEK